MTIMLKTLLKKEYNDIKTKTNATLIEWYGVSSSFHYELVVAVQLSSDAILSSVSNGVLATS